MRKPCGVCSSITWCERLARSGLSWTDWRMASAAWANSPSWLELALDLLSAFWLVPDAPWVTLVASDFTGVVGEGGDCFCITDCAPPAWADSWPITLPPNTPPEPDTVWAMDWGAK